MKSISLQQCQNKRIFHAWMNKLIAAMVYLMICAVLLGSVQANEQQRPPELQSVNWLPGSSGFLTPSGSVGTLIKNGGGSTAAWNAGAVSSQRILRDGRVTFKVTAASQMTVGLSLVSANEGNAEIDFAINVLPTNIAQVYQNGSAGAYLGAYTTTTEFSIRRTGSKIEYLKDGIVINTSTLVSAGSLTVDCSMAKLNSAITSAQIATGDLDNDGMADNWEEDQLPPLHDWADVDGFKPLIDGDLDGVSNLVEFQTGTLATDSLSRSVPMNWLRATTSQLNTDLTANAGGIAKLAPGYTTQYDARAFASQAIVEDGQMMFKVTPRTIMTVGFNTSDVMPTATSADPFPAPDLEWAIITADNGTFFVKPNAANVPTATVAIADSLWAYTADTVFCIRRTAGQIQFFKDGVLLHTAMARSSGPLYPNVWLSSPTAGLALARIDTGDMDNDLLPDVWERQHLRPDSGWNDLLGFTPIGNSDGTVIINHQPFSSGDTISNADELRDGTSPIDPLSKSESVVWRSDRVNVSLPSGSTLGELTKSSTSTTYNARAFGTQAILEDGLVVFQVSGNGVMTLGLNASNVMPLATSVTPDQEWAFTTTATGTYTVKPNAAVVTPTAALNTYNANTRFMIQRVGGVVRFLRDGVVVHTAAAKSSGSLYVNVWMSSPSQQVTLARVYTGDVDNDGMPDAWELSYLASNAGYTELDAFKATGIYADPDGDNIVNLDEYFDGTNPLLPQLKSPVVLWKTNPSNYFTLTGTWGAVKKTTSPAVPAVWDGDAVASKLDAGNLLVPFALGQTARLTFTATPSSTLAMGFTAVDNNRAQTDLEYMIQLVPAASATVPAQASVWEGTGLTTAPVSKFALGTFDANTRFSIRRVARQIDYLKDSQVLYSSVTPVTANLVVDSSFKTKDSEITSARLYSGDVDEDGLPDEWELYHWRRYSPNWPTNLTFDNLRDLIQPQGDIDNDGSTNFQEFCADTDPVSSVSRLQSATWVSPVGVTADTMMGNQGALSKNQGIAAGYNAGAVSEKALVSDGSFIFSANPTGTVAIGLTAANLNASNTDMEYALVLSPTVNVSVGNANVYEGNGSSTSVVKADLGSYTASTIFTIRRVGSTIEYLKNGVLAYTSATAISVPLFADCSINTQNHSISMARMCDRVQDNDNDGLPDEWEAAQLGLGVSLESLNDFDPQGDDDGDDVLNVDEYLSGTSAVSADTDGDGMSDRWELDWGLAATDASNKHADLDSDGLSNLGEFQAGSNPFDADSDDDEMPDGYEVAQGLNALIADALQDKDGDKVPNLWEYSRGTFAGSATSLPAWDATVDPSANDNPSLQIYNSLQEAYDSLAGDPSYHALILCARGMYGSSTSVELDENGNSVTYTNVFGTTLDMRGGPVRKVAFLAEGGAKLGTGQEGAVFQIPNLVITGDAVFNGIIFQNPGAIFNAYNGNPGQNSPVALLEIRPELNQSKQVRFVNCVFRQMFCVRSELGDYPANEGLINNYGSKLEIEHCTVVGDVIYSDSSNSPVNGPMGYTISNHSGSLFIKNSIINGGGDTGVFGAFSSLFSIINTYTDAYVVTPPPSTWGFVNISPQLDVKGYTNRFSAVNTSGYILGTSTSVKYDIHGQTRSLSSPTIGALEYIDLDQDYVPDWWEKWWFMNTTTSSAAVTNPIGHPGMTMHTHYYRNASGAIVGDGLMWSTLPSIDRDKDQVPDSWEWGFWTDLLLQQGSQDSDYFSVLTEYLWTKPPFSFPLNPTKDDDLDNDNFPDCAEIQYWGDLRAQSGGDDADRDGTSNSQELNNGTLPNRHWGDNDVDGPDGLVDSVELTLFGNLNQTGVGDYDQDGFSNATEIWITGTNPKVADTNGDGYLDGYLNSLLATDSDGDGLTNAQEATLGSNPRLADTDGDDVLDGTDAFPLNAMMQLAPQSNPLDTTAPSLTLDEPLDAQLLP